MTGRSFLVFIQEVDGGCIINDASGGTSGCHQFDTVTGPTLMASLKKLHGSLIHSNPPPPERTVLRVETNDTEPVDTEPGNTEIPTGD